MFRSCQCFLMWALVFATVALSSRTFRAGWMPVRCPRHCVCQAENAMRRVYCDIQNKQDLTAVPTYFPSDAELITLVGNKISTIPVGAFSNMRQLRYLNLGSNELQSLPSDVFRGLSNLKSLNLAKNRLSILPAGLLKGLSSLQDLYLDGNVLENLPKDLFEGLTSLKRLFLHSNKFQTLSQRAFGFHDETLKNGEKTGESLSLSPASLGNFTSLVELTLNHNGIGQVQRGSFKRMSVLKKLKLNNNNISTLPQGLFQDLKSLRLLSLYNNPFECTCSLKWLKDWILHNRKTVTVFYRDRIRCHGPPSLKGKPLIRVRDEEFKCGDKQWAEWSSWTQCTKTCGGGRQIRTRHCTEGKGKCEGEATNWRVCNTQKCEPYWSVWTSWTPCTVTCSMGYQKRSRRITCKTQPCRGATCESCQRRLHEEVRACVRGPCPSYTEWSSWTKCNAEKECGLGKQTRSRVCTTKQLGVNCSGVLEELKACKVRECAEWSPWSGWTACSKNCSQGKQTRRRECIVKSGFQKACPGNNMDQRFCNLGECPIHGGWSPWLPWSICSKTCGLGFNTRHRKCSNPAPQHGGDSCKGDHFEVTPCVRGLCKDGDLNDFSPWSAWSKCSTQCGTGIQSRSRECTKRDPVSGFSMCLGNTIAYRQCEISNCHTKGVWGQWSEWSKCFGSCNQGQTFRWRFCVDRRGFGGYTCTDNKTFNLAKKPCKPTTCNHHPVWSTWSNWSECSKSCASGSKRRKRVCLTRVIGQECPGPYEDKARCNTQGCPVNGGWSEWSMWSKCSQPCSGGIQQRSRTCDNPFPQNMGQLCIGDSSEKVLCNQFSCNKSLDIQGDGREKPDPITKEIRLVSPNCQEPERPKNGKYVIKKQRDDFIYLEYKCNKFFRNKGPSHIRHCMNNGEWSGTGANCVLDCGELGYNAVSEARLSKDKSIKYLNESWPWHAAIEVHKLGIHCGGSLIGDQWIITAAHCVLQAKTKKFHEWIKVYLGTNNIGSDFSTRSEVQVIPVKEFYHHKNFDWKVYDSDIAILKLERRVHITKDVHPICLPRNRRRKRLIKEGKMGIMVGWGSKKEPDFLRQIPLPVASFKRCARDYKAEKNDWKVTQNMLCAGYDSKARDTCRRDSGGGLIFLDKRGNKARWILGGIVSWGYPRCGELGKYSVFTNVSKYIRWIINVINP